MTVGSTDVSNLYDLIKDSCHPLHLHCSESYSNITSFKVLQCMRKAFKVPGL